MTVVISKRLAFHQAASLLFGKIVPHDNAQDLSEDVRQRFVGSEALNFRKADIFMSLSQ